MNIRAAFFLPGLLSLACAASQPLDPGGSKALRTRPLVHQGESGSEGPESGEATVSIFLGGAGELDDEYGVAYGVDFGYRVGPRWGVGAYAEAVTGVERVFAGGAFAFLNPAGGWVVLAGPGVERAEGEWGPIWRLGTTYEIPLEGGWLVVPGVYFDFSEFEDLVLYGVAFGRSW